MANNPQGQNLYNQALSLQSQYNNGNAGQMAAASNQASNLGVTVNGTQYTTITNPNPAQSTGDYVAYKQGDTALGTADTALGTQQTALAPQTTSLSGGSTFSLAPTVSNTDAVNAAVATSPTSLTGGTQLNYSSALPKYDELTSLSQQQMTTQATDPSKAVLTTAQAQTKADPLAAQKTTWQTQYTKGTAAQKQSAINAARKNGYTFTSNGKLTTVAAMTDYFQGLINNAIASGDTKGAQAQYNRSVSYGAKAVMPYVAKSADASKFLPTNYNKLMTPQQIQQYASAQANSYYTDQLAGYQQEINKYQALIKDLPTSNSLLTQAQKVAKMKYEDAILQNMNAIEDAKVEYDTNIRNIDTEFNKNESSVNTLAAEQAQRAKVSTANRGFYNTTILDQMNLNINKEQMGALKDLLTSKQNNIANLDAQLANLQNQVSRQAASLTQRQQDEAKMMYDELWSAREKERKEYTSAITQATQNIGRAKNTSNSMKNELYSTMYDKAQNIQEERNKQAQAQRLAQQQMAQERALQAQRLAAEKAEAAKSRAFQAQQAAADRAQQMKLKSLAEAQEKATTSAAKKQAASQFQAELKYYANDFKSYINKSVSNKAKAKLGSKSSLLTLVNNFAKSTGIKDAYTRDALYNSVLKNQNYWLGTSTAKKKADAKKVSSTVSKYSNLLSKFF